MNTLFDILLFPFRYLDPLWGLAWISALSGIMMILVFKKTSNQQAISKLRRKMGSRALGMLLFLESPLTVIKLAFSLITDNFVYLWHLLKPMLIITIPFLVTAAQLDARYSREPLDASHPATVTVLWKDSIPSAGTASPEYGVVISPVVTIPDSLEQSFSFTGTGGLFVFSEMGVRLGTAGQSGSIMVRGTEKRGIIQSLFRPWNGVLEPGTAGMRSTIQETRYHILGGRWSWFAVFLVFSSVWAIIGAVVFKVKV
ncbi:MAG: hypothetical protein B1H09_08040 [Gemmatimonadaceae bacterium 4484_173]|nr:MAG: hypothetical protein B1H09_08040 [Gemmatimonadaceae bacterium 4484_173]RKZ02900.1 MAG: hypothetical protein DRQ21_07350 [Candidatus Fermentibacteria bacterium]